MATGRYAPIWLAAALSLLALLSAWLLSDAVIGQEQLAARYTARAAFALFIVTFSASALARLWPGEITRGLLRRRRQWGLGFALAHTIHLAALIHYFRESGEIPQTATVIGGGFAYLLMFAMAATSNDRSVRAMGAWWKRLHKVGIHYIWFNFALTYLGRIFRDGTEAQRLLLFPACLAALGLRIAAALSVRRQRVPA